MKKCFLTVTGLLLVAAASGQSYNWAEIQGAPSTGGKQDGIYFINQDTGWVVNGSGRIYKTTNGGSSWIQQHNSPGTYFRAVAFGNAQMGFAGNIGVGYFPGVSDTVPLYKTVDGGNSWSPITNISGIVPKGICAINVINNNVVYAAGRVGSPATIMKSTDGGNNWTGISLASYCNMILDMHFQTPDTGYVFAGSNGDIAQANAIILRTTDGGQTWTNVYTSARTHEIIWKAAFPSASVGYATVQSYHPGTTQRYVVKTTDGGLTWTELPLSNTGTREFGIGFINEQTGWVGGENTGYQTTDGGATWTPVDIGKYANKLSIVNNNAGGKTAYAVGLKVYKTNGMTNAIAATQEEQQPLVVYPNPASSNSYISIAVDNKKSSIVKAELIAQDGQVSNILFDKDYAGTHESPFYFRLPKVAPGVYHVKFTDKKGKAYQQKLVIK